jgi:SecD/SecF fusion protein
MTPVTVRKAVLNLSVLALAVWAIFANDVVLGLDLQGGVTLRYELQAPSTAMAGSDVDSMIESTISTLRSRIDAYGIKETAVTRQGINEVVIELPGRGKDEAQTIKSVIARVGRLEWRIVAEDDLTNGVIVEDELARLSTLLAERSGLGPDEFDITTLDLVYPEVTYRWIPYSNALLAKHRGVERLDDLLPDGSDDSPFSVAPLNAGDYLLMRLESARIARFTGGDIANAAQGMDGSGGSAVRVIMKPERSSQFGDFTELNKGRQLAILLDGRIGQKPATIKDRLDDSFEITSGQVGGFTQEEIRDYLTVIRSGSLQMKPRLLYESTIGPSLGESSIASGKNAMLYGFLTTIVFMIFYYRWRGVHATFTLFANLLVLGGLLMFLDATITLPGIAGLVLTLGMAVDANILIYERMREEGDHDKSPAQIVKTGFEKALSTIVDTNLTTFITALILYKVGTGPVRGFAVVLMLGILTSVWAALSFGRNVFDIMVESGRLKSLGSMMRMVKANTHIRFMSVSRASLRVSTVLVVGGLIAFFMAPEDKYGLDFVGGYKSRVRLTRPATQGEVKAAVATVFPGAQVISIAAESNEGSSTATQFVIRVKGTTTSVQASAGETSLEDRFEQPIKDSLAGLIRPDFIEGMTLIEDESTDTTRLEATLNFEGPISPDDVATQLVALTGLKTSAAGPKSVWISARLTGLGKDQAGVTQQLKNALAGAGLSSPSEPLRESTTISGRVGTELRDSAARALIFSIVAVVIYIRLRFREYRYGYAAVLALLHDVCITLGVVSLAHWSGIIDVEINLAMIAAFLTIIGYSLNDTIVLFDRVRENIPRVDKPMTDIIDISVNQVLSRSLLTSITVLITLLVIFFFNVGQQNILEGFSFAMIVGVVVGTYSSIFVASPVLLLLTPRKERKAS